MSDSAWRLGDRYLVADRIGSGGMADVLRAHDELLDRDVAVKVFRSVPSTPDTAVGADRQAAELRALARLNHPNLTVLYDGSIGGDGPSYLVMELIDGPSLAEELGAGPMNPARVAEVGAQVSDALAYVHAAGMVHRDVKPANILLGSDRIVETDWARARLTDFGIVRLVGDEGLTQADMTLGSASYLAPEQTRGSAVGPEADVYALGLSLLEALTGHRAFEGPALEAAMARLSKDPEIPADLPAPWPALLAAMTAREPAKRPTAAQVAKILRGADSTASALAAVPAYPVAPVAPSTPLGEGTTQFIDRASSSATGATLAGAGLAGAGLAGAGLAGAAYGAGALAGTPTGATVALPPQLPPVRSPAESGSWVPGGPPPPPGGGPRRNGMPWVIPAVVAVIALLALGIVLLVTSGSGGGGGGATTAPPTTRTTTHPSTTHASSTHAPKHSASSSPSRSASSSVSSSASSSASSPSAPSSPPRTSSRPSSSAASSSASSSSSTTAAAAAAASTSSSTPANP